jgi:hypothetical protein
VSRLVALLLAVALTLPAWARAQAPPPAPDAPIQGLERLSPEERAVAERNLERWRNMTPEQRERMDRNLERWRNMTPEQRQQAREQMRQRRPGPPPGAEGAPPRDDERGGRRSR